MISIITVTYNNFDQLCRTLDSLKEVKGIERVVVNGGNCKRTKKLLNSFKGISIKRNSSVALNFYWKTLLRQVRIEGVARLVAEIEADRDFNSRPEESRIGAWASDQSSELNTREELEYKVNEYRKKFKGKKIPRPAHWSGFRVEPKTIEFWQDMPFRLHDRVEYNKIGKIWKSRNLYP